MEVKQRVRRMRSDT